MLLEVAREVAVLDPDHVARREVGLQARRRVRAVAEGGGGAGKVRLAAAALDVEEVQDRS